MLPGLLAEEALIVLLQVMTFLVSDPVSCTKGWPRNPWICKKIMLLWMWHETSHPEKFLNSESRIEKWKNYSLLLVLPILIPLQLIWFFGDPKFAPGVLCALPWVRSLSHLPAWNASSYSPNTSPKLHRCKVPKKCLWKHLLEFCKRKNEKDVLLLPWF